MEMTENHVAGIVQLFDDLISDCGPDKDLKRMRHEATARPSQGDSGIDEYLSTLQLNRAGQPANSQGFSAQDFDGQIRHSHLHSFLRCPRTACLESASGNIPAFHSIGINGVFVDAVVQAGKVAA